MEPFDNEVDVLDDEDVVKVNGGSSCRNMNVRKFIGNHKWTVLCIIFIVIIAALAATSVYLGVDGGRNRTQLYVRNTAEYQTVSSDHDLTQWSDREGMLKRWLNTINSASEFLEIQYNQGKSDARHEYNLNTDKCNIRSFVRVREYVQGDHVNTSTLDLKSKTDATSPSSACFVPYQPAVEFVSNSSQKCERDVHVCFYKYSRETRINLDWLPYATLPGVPCSDLHKYYPFLFSSATDMTENASKVSVEDWFVYSYVGPYTGSSDVEISFTLRYTNIAAAIAGTTPPVYFEWSIRSTSENHGYDATWDPDVVADTERVWNAVIASYGNADTEGC